MENLVSIIITSFNRGRLLERAVQSALDQEYSLIEVIIVDDNSTDYETISLLDEFSSLKNILVIRNKENRGANFCRNMGIKAASGVYYTGLDDDDYMLPNRIKILLEHYNDDLAFVCDNYLLFDGKNYKPRFSGEKTLSKSDLLFSNSAGNQVFTTMDKMKSAEMFDENLKRLQDQDMWLRLIILFGKAKRINCKTYIMDTSHDGERITNNIKSANAFSDFHDKHCNNMSKLEEIRSLNRIHFFRTAKPKLSMLLTPKLLIKSFIKK